MNAVVKHLSVGRVISIILAIIIILSLTLPMWFEDIKVIDILATGALIIGPVLGVYFIKQHDREADIRRERMKMLNDIICYGGNPYDVRTLFSLQLIPAYFNNQEGVLLTLETFNRQRLKLKELSNEWEFIQARDKSGGGGEHLLDKYRDELRRYDSAHGDLIEKMCNALGVSFGAKGLSDQFFEDFLKTREQAREYLVKKHYDDREIRTGWIKALGGPKGLKVTGLK